MKRINEFFHLLRRLIMSVDALNAAVAKLSTDVDTLIAQGANSVPQAAVDAATAAVQAVDAKVVAATTPAPAPTPAP
jgi:hypothetical protein